VPLVHVYAFAAGFSACYVCRAYPLDRRRPLAIAAGVGMPAAWDSLLATLAPGEYVPVASGPVLASMFVLGLILYGLAAAVHYLLIESKRVRQLETQRLQMKLTAQDAELRMPRAQVDPRFLFNSLNSISALTSLDPPGARTMTVQLAEFFRLTLSLRADSMVTLDRELQLVRRFVAIEQVRFGDRLRFEASIDLAAEGCLLPPMLLQPLVENAVKHGIGQMLDAGLVRIEAVRAGSLLRLCVENDVGPDGAGTNGARRTGLGLVNVRQRVAAAYGHEASVRWARRDGRFVVELALPVPAADAPRSITESEGA
jgi:LytS/YehU family sensor histidine kinase